MITGEIDLTNKNYIDIGNTGQLVFLIKEKSFQLIKNKVLIWSNTYQFLQYFCFLVYCYCVKTNISLFCDSYGLFVYILSLKDGIIIDEIKLNRNELDDSGMYRNDFIALENGCLLVYEGGIIRFDLEGKLLWQRKHNQIDKIFTSISNGYAWYESEFEGEWGYNLVDGAKKRSLHI
jgi:hypothetical protein